MTRYLTKSRFKLALECSTKLYYQSHKEYVDSKLDNEFLKALARGGFQVGELAKCYYPQGVMIEERDHDIARQQTEELLRGDCVIFEAAFRFENLFIRADIVVKAGNTIRLIEVKAKSFNPDTETFMNIKGTEIMAGWKSYLYDVAFQKHVIQKAYPECRVTAVLMLVDKSKNVSVDGLNQKFLVRENGKGRNITTTVGDVSIAALGSQIVNEFDVDDIVNSILTDSKFKDNPAYSFTEWIQIYSDAYLNDIRIWDQLKSECGKCEFNTDVKDDPSQRSGFHECWEHHAAFNEDDFLEPSILTLYNFKKKTEFIQARKYFQKDVSRVDLEPKVLKPNSSDGLSIIDRQEVQIQKSKDKDASPYVDIGGLRAAMSEWKYPLHFIDFETTAVAIPFNKGLRPYEQVAFQFSHHVMQKDGTVDHRGEWLNDRVGAFPNFDFVRALKAELREDGTIFRYASHENTILNAIYWQLKASSEPDKEVLCDWIKTITKSSNKSNEQWEGSRNMVDLLELVKKYYYHPATRGSNSIKAVLPAILSTSPYLQEMYGKPIYGTTMKSLNFRDRAWFQWDDEGHIINPYELLDPVFQGISPTLLDSFFMPEESDVQDGGTAMIAYAQMQFTLMTDTERQFIRKALLQYCELDTLAMVMVVQEWRRVIGSVISNR
ncbi:MAG: DUF2779 domain-containing protein [Chryseolinea sp.]